MALTVLISARDIDELNSKVADQLDAGMYIYGGISVIPADDRNVIRFYQYFSDTPPASGQDGKSAYELWLDAGNTGSLDDFFNSVAGVRQKSEVLWSGVSVVIPTSSTNLINLIKSVAISSGTLLPFFDPADNKFHVFDEDTTVTFKLNLVGSWTGASTNRSMTINFASTVGNTLTETRDQAVTVDTVSFATFFSVDKGGNLATNGSDITIVSNGATFTATTILLIAEQVTPV